MKHDLDMTQLKKNTTAIGNLGEQIAATYLIKHGFVILETNYWKKWGEIDIIARKGDLVHFVEVKAVSHETKDLLQQAVAEGIWRPEELVHRFKLHQISKALETWIGENKYEGEWQIDVIAVRMVPHETYASVNYIANIVVD